MNRKEQTLSNQYRAALARHLHRPAEERLAQAYELGRQANACGLGVLDMVRIHHQAYRKIQRATFNFQRSTRGTLRSSGIERRMLNIKSFPHPAEAFLLEVLSPFEATHIGFRDANFRLNRAIEALEMRNAQLAATNCKLQEEMARRKRATQALEKSELHYRELFLKASRMQEDLRRLSIEILHVQEQERHHISRELHDQIGGDLAAIDMSLGILRRNGEEDPRSLTQKLSDIHHLLAQTMDNVHRFARELRPAMLDELGLLPALRSYLNGLGQHVGLRVIFRGCGDAERLNSEQKTVLFRVAQESLTNVAKHARASRVALILRGHPGHIQMEIRDNGRSFPVERQLSDAGRKRLGLLGMQERVRLVNGRFNITSTPGKGTTVCVDIPFTETNGKQHPHAANYHLAG